MPKSSSVVYSEYLALFTFLPLQHHFISCQCGRNHILVRRLNQAHAATSSIIYLIISIYISFNSNSTITILKPPSSSQSTATLLFCDSNPININHNNWGFLPLHHPTVLATAWKQLPHDSNNHNPTTSYKSD